MTREQQTGLRVLEGRSVHVALADGSRLDDVALVSARSKTLWVFTNGEDTFVPVTNVVEVWESRPSAAAA